LNIRVISGGQTGVDRAALDVALELGVPCGGCCPKGRKAQNGRIYARYPLNETNSARYQVRTEKNLLGSDGTLVLTEGRLTGATALTVKLAQEFKKPYMVVDLDQGGNAVRAWMEAHKIRVLNVAGPRESKCPGIHDKAEGFLRRVLGDQSLGVKIGT